jgi:hypothetical protein
MLEKPPGKDIFSAENEKYRGLHGLIVDFDLKASELDWIGRSG